MHKKLFILFLFAWSAAAFPALAHLSGQTVEKIVGEYTVDIGYDSIDVNPIAGEPVRFDFRLYKGEEREEVEFTNAWFKTSLNNSPMIAGRLAKDEFIPTGILMTFPEGGDYDITIRFLDKDQALAETVFPLTVAKAAYETVPKQDMKNKWAALAASLLAIGGIIYWFGFRKKR